MWARNIDSRSRTAKQLRFKSALVPVRLFQNPISQLLYGDFCNKISSSNSWAEFAALFRNTREAFLDHERAKSELKALMPEDAKEAIGHGVRAKRSKAG